MLDCFTNMIGLNINYSKSAIISICYEENWAADMADALRCKIMSLPITYLGIALGANSKKVSTWKLVMERIEKRLSMWKAKTLSRASRLILIKSVLNNMPIYYMELFKIPKAVVKKIIQVQRKFFWAGSKNGRGIPLVAWEIIQRPKHLGGLCVGDLVIKNTALLFKWWWHFFYGNESLWKRVIASNHYRSLNIQELVLEEGVKEGLWGQVMSIPSTSREISDVISSGLWRKI